MSRGQSGSICTSQSWKLRRKQAGTSSHDSRASGMPSLNLKKLAMGIVPYGGAKAKDEHNDSDDSSHSTVSRAGSEHQMSRSGSTESASSRGGHAAPAGVAAAGGGAQRVRANERGTGERTLDEESMLNGWVRRYFALQHQVSRSVHRGAAPLPLPNRYVQGHLC